ncbi:MAG: site-2 protease family protein [Candidatus Aenigmarchaeota archaeon]|nr:site-2 protease family protein [Candidatus Aenigmarchaeota archaeon]
MDVYLLSVILFFSVLAVLIYKYRKRIDVKYYILFTFRTKRFSQMIDNIAKKSPKFWKIISTIAIFVCFYYMFQGVYLLLLNSQAIYEGIITQPGLQLVLPSASATASSGPGYMLIPFWFWIITIFCILVPHELSHGIIARAEKIRLKSVGLLLFGVLPGAFVEPDEKQLKKAKTMPRLRVFAAGSGANFLVAALVLFMVSYIIWPMGVSSGIQILSVNESSPADMAGIKSNMTFYQVNGNVVETTYQEYLAGTGYLGDELKGVKPNQTIVFQTDTESYYVNLKEINGHPFMGIIYKPVFKMDIGLFLGNIIPLLTMIWLFSFAIGLFNILPLYPLDGGLMLEAVSDRFMKKHTKTIVKTVSMILLLIILYNFFGPSLM